MNNKEIIELIKEKAFLTGSRAWGIEKENSDIDYFCEKSIYHSMRINILGCNKLDYVGGSYEDSCYFTLNGLKYNLFSMADDAELFSWKLATKEMVTLCKNEDYKNLFSIYKPERINVFRNFRRMGTIIYQNKHRVKTINKCIVCKNTIKDYDSKDYCSKSCSDEDISF